MTNTEAHEAFSVSWDGSFDGAWWREHGKTQPDPGELVKPSQVARVRDYLEDHPGEWLTVRQVSVGAGTSYDETSDRLGRLLHQGEAERVKGPTGVWVYRVRAGYAAWLEEKRSSMAMMRVQQARHARAVKRGKDRRLRASHEHEAMRARLANRHPPLPLEQAS